MHSLSLHSSATNDAPPGPRLQVERLESTLAERRRELAALQDEFRRFRSRYTQVVGSQLAELAEVEQEIREAERRALGLEDEREDAEDANADSVASHEASAPLKKTLRGLFWSVARMFHPDHAADESEARRRHSIMAEANRAYREGDVESLSTLLGDEELQSYCVSASTEETDEEDFAARILHLREELITVEFGLKRIRQDSLYRLMLTTDEEAKQGRDALNDMADRIKRQITKARHRLVNLV